MNPALFTAHGAQPEKPTRYKPIWTDRFFNGYFSNRNPFRSPLSAYYADGYGLGKTDALIDGVNVEVSPRLTMIRRPGSTAYTSATPAQQPTSFYSFHKSDGTIQLIADAAGSVSKFDTTSITSIYTKPTNAKQSIFQGAGMWLFWADSVTPQKWNASDNNQYQMGIAAPQSAPAYATSNFRGNGTSLTGVLLNGTTGFIKTTTQVQNPTEVIMDIWIRTTSTSTQPILSFESQQTGASTQVYQAIYLNASGQLCCSVYDSGKNQFVTGKTVPNSGSLTDGDWHHVVVRVQYLKTNGSVNGTTIQGGVNKSLSFTPDPSISSTSVNTNNPTVSAVPTPGPFQLEMYIDGAATATWQLPFQSLSTGTGFWRIGNGTSIPGLTAYTTGFWNGYVSECAILSNSPNFPPVYSQWAALISQGVAAYETIIATTNTPVLTGATFYWWKLQETVGTSAADSGTGGLNTGTYLGGFTLNQSLALKYVAYAASTAFALGKVIIDTNGNYQQVTTAGSSGAGAPVWAKLIGQTTTDGTITWTCLGRAGVTEIFGANYVYCYMNNYGHVSTASPASPSTGPRTAALISLTGLGSTDPQVTKIGVFRTADGGSTYFYVGALNNPANGGSWTFTDASPDSSLNILMPAPTAHQNDPPPSGMTNLVYHLGRMWGSVGNLVYCSGGPDTLIGSGNESFPPANYWAFASQVTRLVPTTSGLLVFTTSSVELLGGGPAIPQFYTQTILPKVGLLSWNALDVSGSQITLFTSDRQLVQFDPSGGLTELGFPIADKLAAFNPLSAYVTRHINGLDNALYVGDGATGWYRCCPQQPPDYSITGPVWSPKAEVLPASAPSSPAVFVQGTQNTVTGAASVAQSFVSNNTAGNAIIVIVGANSNTTINTPTDTRGNVYKLLGTLPAIAGNPGGCSIYISYGVAAGANTVTATTAASAGVLNLVIIEYSNLSAQYTLLSNATLINGNVTDGPGITTANNTVLSIAFTTNQAGSISRVGGSWLHPINTATFGVGVNTSDSAQGAGSFSNNYTTNGTLAYTYVGDIIFGTKTGNTNFNAVGGNAGAIISLETSPGIYQLMIAASSGIFVRDSSYATFSDNAIAYEAGLTIGNIVLANPGELAEVGFIACDLIKVGTQPAVSVLMDEISGTFSLISGVIVADPPMLYGPTAQPNTLYSNRYYMTQSTFPAWCRHMQMRIDFGKTDTVMNELLTSTLWGAVLAEGA